MDPIVLADEMGMGCLAIMASAEEVIKKSFAGEISRERIGCV